MVRQYLPAGLIGLLALSLSAFFVWFVFDLVAQGLPRLSLSFFLEMPRDAGRAGGIGSILLSTCWILGVTLLAAAPIALATAIWLSEFSRENRALAAGIESSLHILAGMPSIIFGLFGNAFFCIYLGLGFSILSGGLTLACMVLPILVSTALEGLLAVPPHYRLAAAALGISRLTTLRQLLLPAAAPALAAGLLLGIGRAVAETAALIFTSGYVDRRPDSWLDSGRSLSVHIYDLAMNVAGGDANAQASALVLILWLLAINGLAMSLANYWSARRLVHA